jgi:cyclopropane fatty-acyl-phospholipid synthase-like methyltransferase
MKEEKEWFKNWFDTPFYHVLYDYRNEEEARFFMRNLISFLNLEPGNKILDLPCGKGRHAVFLNEEGFKITGADLSANSIQFAKRFENPDLKFVIHDMRESMPHQYHAILNLFTSFGYFNDEETNIKVLENFKNSLLENGHLVIDFLNLKKVISELVPYEHFTKRGIEFTIRKKVTEKYVIKEIQVDFDGESKAYIEKVQAIDLHKMKTFAEKAGLKILHVFGDHSLNAYDENKSDRLIMILQ